MALLFNISNKTVQPTTEVLLIYPFKDIWDRDTSQNKEEAIKEFAYIEFMTSLLKTNPYKGFPVEIRKERICSDLKIDTYIWNDELVKEAMLQVERFQKEASPTYSLYIAAQECNNKLKELLESLDGNERNDKGMPIYKPKDITGALLDVEKVANSLNNTKKKVEEELYEETKIRANKEISPFANPN